MNKHKITLIVGQSGSGKDYLSWYVSEELDLKILPSYTTRPKRTGEIEGVHHKYIDTVGFTELFASEKLVAYTHFRDNYYGATLDQIYENDLYIIDVRGIISLMDYIDANNIIDIDVSIVMIKTPPLTRLNRMWKRDKSLIEAIRKYIKDKKEFKDIKNIIKDFNGYVYINKSSSDKGGFLKLIQRIRGRFLWEQMNKDLWSQ